MNAEGEGIWFATPPGFTSLPLDALLAPQASAKAEESREVLAAVLAAAPDDVVRQQVLADLANALRLFHTLRAEGTVYLSLGLHRDDISERHGDALLSLFTITWVDTAWAPRGVTAARSVAQAEGHTNIEYAELPCGPATFSESVLTPTDESGLAQKPLLQIHGHLPHPDGRSLAVLTLSTIAAVHREHYRVILRQIAELVSFNDPFASIPEASER
ncbi:hypothetical protein ACIPSA_06365 [Streptomyces sp. NPDC086549]|uniref:hypothetical protein n=1 Tax=Streptomyces sp. NPDC086549 TaxID=3365752 RepID=UPI00382D2D1B